jgi:hypothetical protein
MMKLKTLIVESEELDYDEDVLESLEGVEAIMAYLTQHGKEPRVIDLAGDKYIIWDDKIIDPDWPEVEDKSDWVWSTQAQRLRERLRDKLEDEFNQRYWERPEGLYHGTPKENVESIQRDGLKMQHKSRGLSNRHITRAVFTEQEPSYCQYHYGPEVFFIDTNAMKKDGFMPRVEKEPNHIEADVVNFLAHKIGAWDESGDRDWANSMSEGTTENTIIVYADIPAKYLKLL